MARVLLINASEADETRAALLESGDSGALLEYRCERATAGNLAGNVYLGRVVNLERGIGAAFLDLGVGRNGFLHVSNCAGVGADEDGRIEDHFAVGDPVLVQVTRESIGSKGPVLTGNVSFAGHYCVLLPFSPGGGVSRRIEEQEDRTKLRAIARDLEQDAQMGVIVRTAGADREREELQGDLDRLRRLWTSVQGRAARAAAPALIHAETDLVARALRDMATADVDAIHVDTPEAHARAAEIVAAVQPELGARLHLYQDALPLFHAFDIETQIDRLHARTVPLPGGGSLVFDRTEALVAVDVNSGRMRDHEGLEETALETNLEAAEEIARQLQLRDLGGVVAVDFIDMRQAAHVRAVEKAFRDALARDRARVRAGRLGAFGIFALTRQRRGAGGVAGRRPCRRCGGTGEVVGAEPVAARVFRELRARAAAEGGRRLRARVSPEVAEILEGPRRGALDALAEEAGAPIDLEADTALPPERWEVVQI